MTFYHGNNEQNWAINPHQKSRYGFPALFFTPDIELARLYAVHHYHKTRRHGGGFIHAFDMNARTEPTVDWKYQSTHTLQFRNLICQHDQDFLLIKNCIDYPSKDLRLLSYSDILVCYKPRWLVGLGLEIVESHIVNV